MDAQVGRVLAELDRLGLRDNTIVVLLGDHGWQLGEHGLWNKHTNFEVATRSALVVSSPTQKQRGVRTDALVEFVDIYPTLCDLCGLKTPEHVEGTTFAPLLDEPNRAWKSAAFSQYPRGKIMGYSMRTDRWRYTEWRNGNEAVARELYDHQTDRDENANLANQSEHAQTAAMLAERLSAGWRKAIPV
jgi:iduronate 2-sulfatase